MFMFIWKHFYGTSFCHLQNNIWKLGPDLYKLFIYSCSYVKHKSGCKSHIWFSANEYIKKKIPVLCTVADLWLASGEIFSSEKCHFTLLCDHDIANRKNIQQILTFNHEKLRRPYCGTYPWPGSKKVSSVCTDAMQGVGMVSSLGFRYTGKLSAQKNAKAVTWLFCPSLFVFICSSMLFFWQTRLLCCV